MNQFTGVIAGLLLGYIAMIVGKFAILLTMSSLFGASTASLAQLFGFGVFVIVFIKIYKSMSVVKTSNSTGTVDNKTKE